MSCQMSDTICTVHGNMSSIRRGKTKHSNIHLIATFLDTGNFFIQTPTGSVAPDNAAIVGGGGLLEAQPERTSADECPNGGNQTPSLNVNQLNISMNIGLV